MRILYRAGFLVIAIFLILFAVSNRDTVSVAFITTGIQYMYGRRIVVANAKGSEQVITYKWRVAF